ncbi:MAG TPA: DUF3187 family protein [bacterium]|nr:DUF3187 family protein [bacterium]
MRTVRLASKVGMLALAACVASPDLRGPLAVRNQHPAQLTVLHLDPTSAEVLPPGQTRTRIDAAYTSLFLFGSRPGSSWYMDGEYLRSALDLAVGLGHGLQLGVQIAGAHTSGGFLDGFLIDYHELFGFPDQNRSTTERDRFRVDAQRGSDTVWSVERAGAELLDVPVQLTWQLRKPGERRLGVVLRGGIELPTGDDERGYGNGAVDVGLGIAFDYRIAGVGFTGQLGHTFAGTPGRAESFGLTFADVTSAAVGTELPLASDLHALVQVEYETSTLRRLGPAVASREQVYLWVGGRYQPEPSLGIEIGFGEDLVGMASPDFTAFFAMVWTPGRHARRRRPDPY